MPPCTCAWIRCTRARGAGREDPNHCLQPAPRRVQHERTAVVISSVEFREISPKHIEHLSRHFGIKRRKSRRTLKRVLNSESARKTLQIKFSLFVHDFRFSSKKTCKNQPQERSSMKHRNRREKLRPFNISNVNFDKITTQK